MRSTMVHGTRGNPRRKFLLLSAVTRASCHGLVAMLVSVNRFKLPRAVRHLQAAALQARRASELKDLCRQKGLPLTGNKQQLVDQLVERDTLLSAAKPKELSEETKSRALASGMNVLSLFDGISCGRPQRAGARDRSAGLRTMKLSCTAGSARKNCARQR